MEENNGIMKRHRKWEKLENPVRVAELAPEETLRRLGLAGTEAVCDIGAGSGVFALAAARLTAGAVYAVDTDTEILSRLAEKAAGEGVGNLHPLAVSGFPYPVPDRSVDWVLLVTVLHEIAQKDLLLAEIGRILKPSGRVAVVEFRGEPTPMGPSVASRFGAAESLALFTGGGYEEREAFLLGNNFYCQSYRFPG